MSDRDWIADVVGRFERLLLAYVRSLVGDPHRGRDIVQDAFLELVRKPRADVEPHLAAWLFTVCRRRAIDAHRKEHRMSTLSVDPPARVADPGTDPAEVRDTAAAVLTRVETLPDRQKEAVRLRFQGQLSYREIARVMGLSESHVGVLLHAALKTLRAEFADPETRSQS